MKTILICLALFASSAFGQANIQNLLNETVTETSAKYLDKNMKRTILMIENDGNGTIYVKFDEAHTGEEGIIIKNKERYIFNIAPINSVWIKSKASEVNGIIIMEGVR